MIRTTPSKQSRLTLLFTMISLSSIPTMGYHPHLTREEYMDGHHEHHEVLSKFMEEHPRHDEPNVKKSKYSEQLNMDELAKQLEEEMEDEEGFVHEEDEEYLQHLEDIESWDDYAEHHAGYDVHDEL